MEMRDAATIEIYDGWLFDNERGYRQQPITLFCRPSERPGPMRSELIKRLKEIWQGFKQADRCDWCSAPEFAAKLVSHWPADDPTVPDLVPRAKTPTHSPYLYRVYVNREKGVNVTCFRVKHDKDGLLELMVPLEELESEC